MKLKSLICCCLMVCVPASVWPQAPASPAEAQVPEKKLLQGEQVSKVRHQVEKRGTGEQSKVRISLKDGTEVKGYISRIDATSFQVTDKKTGKVSTIDYDSVGHVRGGGLSSGAKIAIVVGVGAAAAIVLGVMAHTLNHS